MRGVVVAPYYIATEEAVVVLAVWGAIKGAGPRLRRPS